MIINKTNLNSIFTEYDETLTKKLNIDPLGFQIVWTYFGQKIFQNKTTSVALDIRNYNINLFNHYIIYQIIQENGGMSFKKLITSKITIKEKIEKTLIILENLLIWSWYSNRDKWSEKEKSGLLGTYKALSLWEGKESYKINFNEKNEKIEVLKNQRGLGVSGRYKGPFKAMGFFKEYNENSYKESSEIFESVGKIFIEKTPFKELYDSVIEFLKKVQENSIIEIEKNDEIVKNFELCFKNFRLANEQKEFWKEYLGLKNNEAKVIYDEIDLPKKGEKAQNSKIIFQKALEKYQSKIFEDINQLEPQLTYFNLLFDYLISNSENKIDELNDTYIKILNDFKWNFDIKNNSSVSSRIEQLKEIKDYKMFINYHKTIMEKRAQMPWIELKDDKTIKSNLMKNINSEETEKLLSNGLKNDWINDYYIHSIRNIKRGLENETL
jgi:hypothetical protein